MRTDSTAIALFESFGEEDPGGAKFILEEYVSFIGIGGIGVLACTSVVHESEFGLAGGRQNLEYGPWPGLVRVLRTRALRFL